MKKTLFFSSLILLFIACDKKESKQSITASKVEINELLNQWHKDVANYNFDNYFDSMSADAVFVGTDATEVWNKEAFKAFSKPYFDKKQTWDFKPILRNVYIDESTRTAWFDETLDTWMGVCRGSGVVERDNGEWKIQHYVLSVAVPNEDVKQIVSIKKRKDSLYMLKVK